MLFVALLAALVLQACTPETDDPDPAVTGPTVVVGAASDAETRLLAHVAAGLLEAAGVTTELRVFDTARDARHALEFNDIDVLPGYTGATWLEVMERPDPPADPLSSYRRVRQFDLQNGVTWLRPTFSRDPRFDEPPANATFAFFVPGLPTPTASLQTLSQLATRLADRPDARLCVDPDFASRPDGLEPLLRAYNIRLDIDRVATSPADAINGVAAGGCVAGLSTTTDGRAWRAGLKPLRDDLGILPAFVVSLQVTDEARRALPELEDVLDPLVEHLTTALLGGWNARVAAGGPVEVVAAEVTEELLARVAAERAEPSPSPA